MKNNLPFLGIKEFSKHEVIVVALHMHTQNITPNLEVNGNTKSFSLKFLVEKASTFIDA